LMEYIDGHDLKEYIKHRDLTYMQMLKLCIKLAEGLDFLHQHGVVHRDIKPGNFLFSKDGSKVKIVDFGLSKSSNTGFFSRFQKEGGGTRIYMSPEQLRKQKLDARSDIFSFGITIYELFTGKHPFQGMNAKMIQKQIISQKFKVEAPSTINKEVSPQMDRIIMKALRRNLDRRYQSMTEMLMDLTRLTKSRI